MTTDLFTDFDVLPDLTTYEGLEHALTNPVPYVPVLSRTELDALTPAERAHYDQARLDMLSSGITLVTDTFEQGVTQLQQAMRANRTRTTGRTGLLVSGDTTVGKTTLLRHLMEHIHRLYRQQHPGYREAGRVPVAFANVPGDATPRMLMATLARFYGLTVAQRDTTDTLEARVVEAIRACHTQVVMLDEMHNLIRPRSVNSTVMHVLKNFTNVAPATFVLAGLNLTQSELVGSQEGRQIWGRFTALEMKKLDYSDAADRRLWAQYLGFLELRLPLADHKPGTLTNLSKYLWHRTGGSLGSLTNLLFGAATDVLVAGGREQLVYEELAKRRLDRVAETIYAARPGKPVILS